MDEMKKLKLIFIGMTVIGTGLAVVAGLSIPAGMIAGMTGAATVMYLKARTSRIAMEGGKK